MCTWLHVLAGIVWIGLLYYFNFVQVPAMGAALADSDGPGPAAIGKYVGPNSHIPVLQYQITQTTSAK